MNHLGLQFALVAFLVLLNAGFAGSEMALVSLRESQVRRLASARRGPAGSWPGWPATPTASWPPSRSASPWPGSWPRRRRGLAGEPLVPAAGVPRRRRRAGRRSCVTIVLAFVTLVVGELAPKRIAMQRAEGWALVVARPLDLPVERSTRPLVWLLGGPTDVVVRLAGGDPRGPAEEVSQEELETWWPPSASFTAEQRTIIAAPSRWPTGCCARCCPRAAPRRSCCRTPATPSSAALQLIAGARPLAGAGGRAGRPRRRARRRAPARPGRRRRDGRRRTSVPLVALPETLRVADALRQLQAERQQLAVVVDEHGARRRAS